ncbi:MAG: NAD(+)/NADH kinase [Pirellulaceae bacterium]
MNSRCKPGWPSCGRERPHVVIVGALERPSVTSELTRLQPSIAQHAQIVAVDLDFSYDFADRDHDLVIVLGGDGSILQTARQMGEHQLPVLGINCGHLGFLAALTPEAFLDIWASVAAGHCELVDHLMLRASIVRDGKECAVQLGLNEAAILGGPPYRILNIDLSVDQVHATSYSCDGLIISTPVGSTAHNLSAGGPILRKNLQAFVISPLSPHTLTHRSVVDTADRVFDLTVANPNDSTSLVVDGRVVDGIQPGDRIRIQRSAYCFLMVHVPGQNDYRTLREKLGWSGNTISKS